MYAMDKLLVAMSYPHDLGRNMDLTRGGLALQEVSTQHSLQQLSHDPSFAERAAKYSTFGTSSCPQAPVNSSLLVTGRLHGVLERESTIPRSANSLTSLGSLGNGDAQTPTEANFRDVGDGGANVARAPGETKLRCDQNQLNSGVESIQGTRASINLSNEGVIFQGNSVCSQQAPVLTTAHRKRKGNSLAEGKDKSSGGCKLLEASTDNSAAPKRHKSVGENVKTVKAEQASASENSGDSTSPRSTLKGATSKSSQDFPKQDYIHVRARRGQATDSHSLAERVRREKISERMKFLQDLVPGCSKVTGKAVMLDEIINYVQSLQRQIEFLSMKLATVITPRLDYSYDLLGKDMPVQSRSPETTLLGPDSLAGPFGDHSQCAPIPNVPPPSCHFEALYLRRSMSVPTMMSMRHSSDHFSDPVSQGGSGLCDGDLQSVVKMGFVQGRQDELDLRSQLSSAGELKVEL